VDTAIVLENDLYRRAEARTVHDFFEITRHVIALDHLANRTVMQAEVALPAATFAETSGTLLNNEGRAQRSCQVFVPRGDVQASWRWLRDVMVATGRFEAEGWQTLDDLVGALAEALPSLRPIVEAAPAEDFRLNGQKVPRQTHRYTARTAVHADANVHEPKPPDDPDSPLAFSMEGYEGQPPAALIPRYWAPHWNSVQALNKFQEEIAGPLRDGDPGVRLIEPAGSPAVEYFARIPAPYEPRAGQWLAVALHHIFGSEELSVLTPGVFELAPEPYLALNPDDAAGLGVQAGEEVEFHIDERLYRLPLRLLPTLPPGIVGLPAGLPEGPELVVPGQWVTISRGSDRE
jgi:NADH-quinone oxidoreductase subunit G